jgi:2-keto-4-pentenoate hydratase/2-oxohepta-3-ene-1,7-dioic acid hydratase in catechol pathway
MKLLTFKYNNIETVGVLSAQGDRVYPISSFGLSYKTMNAFIENVTDEQMEQLKQGIQKNAEGSISLSDIEKMAPIPNPKQDIICLGINYMAHAEESARYKKEDFGGERPYAVYFSKRVAQAVADGGIIPSYEGLVDSLDYEVELAVVIKKDAKNVAKEEAFDYVLGYTIINDVSARNLQTRHKQWYFGKSLDGFTPMGPWIVTADEFNNPPALKIVSRVNGEVRQNATTDLLIFTIEHVIAELTQGMTLKAGTIIAMGTPAGVGMGFVPPKFLKAGDKVECEIEGIGCITNSVK